jgi:hypothetical protein
MPSRASASRRGSVCPSRNSWDFSHSFLDGSHRQADSAKTLLRHRPSACCVDEKMTRGIKLIEIEELAPRVRPAGRFKERRISTAGGS